MDTSNTNKNIWGRAAAFVAVLALVAAGCGSGSDDVGTAAPQTPDAAADPVALPSNPNPSDAGPPIADACLEGEPECNDIGVPTQDPRDLPLSIDEEPGVVTNSGALAGDGLTPGEELSTDATGVLAITGFLVDTGTETRLCELLAESLPPQCGESSIPVTGYDEVIGVPLQNAQGVTWTDDTVTLFGAVVDGVFVVDATVIG